MRLETGEFSDRTAIVLPDDLLSQLGWEHGDVLEGEVVDGALRIARTQTKHDQAMQIAREIMEEYRETFETLAKS